MPASADAISSASVASFHVHRSTVKSGKSANRSQMSLSRVPGTARPIAESVGAKRSSPLRVLEEPTHVSRRGRAEPTPSLKGREESCIDDPPPFAARGGSVSPLPFREGGPGGVGSARGYFATSTHV